MDTGCIAGASSSGFARASVQAAWTMFWQAPGQIQCVSGAPSIRLALTQHWSSFADSLAAGARVLDLGCGAGAVARALLAQRPDVYVTGIDFAKVPLAIQRHVELLSDTAMESLPFADESFGAAVSQFGFEYGAAAEAAAEMARVLAPGGRFSFLVHHAGSATVADNLARMRAIAALLSPNIRTAFLAGDAAAFGRQLTALTQAHPYDGLIAELSHALPARLVRPERERAAIWTAVEDALAPERCILAELRACAVAPMCLDDWLAPLRAICNVQPVSVLHEPGGQPIAWRVDGARRRS
jgi:SAM-dependent methyltransferase